VPHANLGRLLREEGQPAEAAAWLKTATKLDSVNATYWNELADLHWDLDAAPAAISCWQRALALDPNRPLARNSLGWALQEEGRLAEANECYQAALRLQPDLAPAHLNVGVFHEEKGELAEAESSYREAIRLQPAYAFAHSRLATLLRSKLPDADLAAIDACLASPQLDDGPRARLLFGLAHVLDARGDPSRAAECLRIANVLSLNSNRQKMRSYDPAEHDRFVDGLIAGFGTEWFNRTVATGAPSRRPIFVFGLPRSGTTLVEQILASHPAVHGAGELALARRGFESMPAALGRSDPPLRCLTSLSPLTTQRIAERHLNQLTRLASEQSERVVDKMPENYLYLGWLVALFPNAVFIHCNRDLRDIALSCWKTDFRSLRWANSSEHIAARIAAYQRLMAHWEATCPVPIHSVRYEETVSDLEAVTRRLLAACGLEWHPACLEFHRSSRTVRTASVTQVRQPIYSTSVARWRKYERELAELFALLPKE
jgi:tetratricopeptide (TPR) repeat protein